MSFHVDSSFIFSAESIFHCMYVLQFVYLFTYEGHKKITASNLGAIMNKAPVTLVWRFLCGCKFSTPLDKLSRSMIARSNGKLICLLSFVRNCQTIFQNNNAICTPISNEWQSSCAFAPTGISGFSHSKQCVVVSNYCLICNSLTTSGLEPLFVCLLPSVHFLWWTIYSDCHTIFQLGH